MKPLLKRIGLGLLYVLGPVLLAAQVYDASGRTLVNAIITGSVAVTGPLTDAELRATPVPVSGTVTVTDGSGALNVIVDSSALPTGASTSANQTTIIGHVDGLEGFVDGIEGLLTTLAGAVSGTEMQVDVLTMPTVTVTDGAGAMNVIVDSIAAGNNNIGDVDVASIAAGNNNIGDVDIASIVAGTNYIGKVRLTDGTLDSTLVDETGTNAVDVLGVGGGTPADSVDSGNPLKIGGKAFSFGTGPTAVAANDRANASFNREGVMFMLPGTPTSTVREYMWTTAQTNDAVITVSSGTRIGVTGFQVTLDEATTVGVGIRCGFATATLTTAPTDGNGADNTFLHHVGIVPGGGLNSPPGMLAVGADDEDVRCTTEATTSGTGKLFVYYFTTAN